MCASFLVVLTFESVLETAFGEVHEDFADGVVYEHVGARLVSGELVEWLVDVVPMLGDECCDTGPDGVEK